MSESLTRYAPCCCAFRWSGRITAVILLAAWALLVALEGVPPKANLSTVVWCQFAAMLALFAGYAIAFRRERAGALLAATALGFFYLVHFVGIGGVPQASFALFGAPIVMFFLAYRLDRHERTSDSEADSDDAQLAPSPA